MLIQPTTIIRAVRLWQEHGHGNALPEQIGRRQWWLSRQRPVTVDVTDQTDGTREWRGADSTEVDEPMRWEMRVDVAVSVACLTAQTAHDDVTWHGDVTWHVCQQVAITIHHCRKHIITNSTSVPRRRLVFHAASFTLQTPTRETVNASNDRKQQVALLAYCLPPDKEICRTQSVNASLDQLSIMVTSASHNTQQGHACFASFLRIPYWKPQHQLQQICGRAQRRFLTLITMTSGCW